MSSSESDAADEDYAKEEITRDAPTGDADGSTGEARAAASARASKLWEELDQCSGVSKAAVDRSAKLLSSLTSGRPAAAKKKRKLREFRFSLLSVDPKRSRRDLAAAGDAKTAEQVVKFAGVEYSVSKRAGGGASASGVDKALAALDAPKKVSTIEKTSIDWDKFKQQEGIEDELAQYTKDGYVEKQEFLQRLDLKRFEIEKAERDKQRKQQQQQQQQQ